MPPDGEGECHKARRINTPPPPPPWYASLL